MKLRSLILGALMVMTMAACGGSDSDDTLPELSKTTTPEKTTGTLLDKVPSAAPERPKDAKTDVGALKFSAYVFDALFYTLATNDIDELMSIADPKRCRTCTSLRTSIEKRPGRVQVSSEPQDVSKAKVASKKGGLYNIEQNVLFPSGAEIDKKTGKVVETLDSREIDMDVDIQWRKGKWVLIDYKSAKEGQA